MDEIHKLKSELIFLMQSQMQTQQIEDDPNENITIKVTENDINTQSGNPTKSTEDEMKIPPLQNIFIHNKKFLVLDHEKYVWHLKKCRKYQKFVEINNEKFNGNKVEIFNAYFEDVYETTEENKTQEKENKYQIPITKEHIFISENLIYKNEILTDNLNNYELIQHDNYEKNNLPKNGALDFDISKMSDMSNFVNEMDQKHKIRQNKTEKNEENVENTSLDLSDDG